MINYIPILLIILPLAGALLVWFNKEKYSSAISIIITSMILLLSTYLYEVIIISNRIIIFELPFFIYGLWLAIDSLSFLLIVVTSLIWFLSTIFAIKYMSHEHNQKRFYAFSLLTLMSNLGVLLGKDLFTIFVFFELLGLLSYVLIIHTETIEAKKAGLKYISMTIAGGLCLLFGIFLYFNHTGTMDLYAYTGVNIDKNIKILIGITLIAGFGVKAGMIPLHIWLPDAHPAAPTPASAILSGVMIKAGAYGILRVTQLPIFTSGRDHFNLEMGFVIIGIGIITMFVGVILALLQSNAKRLLAYHSISQMGYILMGIGCALYLGEKGAVGITGSVYHIINHALFKSSLFFAAGAVYLQTREYNLYNLGGLYRKMPLLAVLTVIAACGISGIPFFNGYISKTILHHAILDSYNINQNVWLKTAEIIFVITSAGTLCSFIKFSGLMFFSKSHSSIEQIKKPSISLVIPSLIIALFIISLGIFPKHFIEYFLKPINLIYFKPDMMKSIEHLYFWNAHNLSGVIIPIIGGSMTFFIGMKFGLFHYNIPAQIGFDYWYQQTAKLFLKITLSGYDFYKKTENNFKEYCLNLYNLYNKAISDKSTYLYKTNDLSQDKAKLNLDNSSIFNLINIFIIILLNKSFKLYMSALTFYHNKTNNIIDLLTASFKKIEKNIMEMDMKRIELIEFFKLKFGYFIFNKWILPIIENHYPEANLIEILKANRNLESLFNLKSKISRIRNLRESEEQYSYLEIKSIIEEKYEFIFAEKEIYFKAAQRMLQFYTTDIGFGSFLIILSIVLFFLIIILKI